MSISMAANVRSSNVRLNKVAIVGGTHGNELTGAYLIQKFERHPYLVKRSSFKTLTLLGNPRALAANTRYIDRDLNRCFAHRDLENTNLATYEDIRAREINQILGTKSNPQIDLIVDCHSTTANMGLTLILGSEQPFLLALAAHICTLNPLVKVYRWNNSNSLLEDPFLRSLSPLGLTVEVGAIAHGVLEPELCTQTEQLIYAILNYLEAFNLDRLLSVPSQLTLYQNIQVVDFPRNERGEITAKIHTELLGRDFAPLKTGAYMFQTFAGENISYEGSTVYPVFIGESSYEEKGIAMCLTQKRQISQL